MFFVSLFCCPICGAPLTKQERSYVCPNRHCYDIAKEGYVNLLPANKKHAKDPGDDKEMAAARTRFLDGGHYAPLRQELCRLIVGKRPNVLLDSGCGEGYYTAGVCAALEDAGLEVRCAGVDLSRSALKKAARREPAAEFAVASVYHMPVKDAQADVLLNCFSPLALDEFRRVLRRGGTYLYVVPGARHLWELKQVLYDTPYENPEEDIPYAGFEYEDMIPVEFSMDLDASALGDLFRMTPYYWKTPREGAQRLAALSGLKVTASFRIHVLQLK